MKAVYAYIFSCTEGVELIAVICNAVLLPCKEKHNLSTFDFSGLY